MCGIVGYIGDRKAQEVLIKGLERLEYRGYDSAGIVLCDADKLKLYKKKGELNNLKAVLEPNDSFSTGIGHTRWATHGKPNDLNAHPHISMKGKISLVHNGIIENYLQLQEILIKEGYSFKSDTDSEVLVNWIEFVYLSKTYALEDAVEIALESVRGTYGLVIFSPEDPQKLVVTRRESPLVVGLGDKEYFVASDATPIVEYTNRVFYLENDDLVILKRDGFSVRSVNHQTVTPIIKEVDLEVGSMDKGEFPHFMLKEIFEQPSVIRDTCRGRLDPNGQKIVLGGLRDLTEELTQATRIHILACGTSWHAGLVGKYLIEQLVGLPVTVEYASEFKYKPALLGEKDLVLSISQSGETADTLGAIRVAKKLGSKVLGICNVVGSALSRETDAGVFTHAGTEISVASTKAFTAQVTVLTMLANYLAQHRGLPVQTELLEQLAILPDLAQKTLDNCKNMPEVVDLFQDQHTSLFLGRGLLFPVALEGALKLKRNLLHPRRGIARRRNETRSYCLDRGRDTGGGGSLQRGIV